MNFISVILKNKNDFLNKYFESSIAFYRKRFHFTMHDDGKKCLFKWFMSVTAKKFPIIDPILKEKAMQFADFILCNEWSQCFKDCHAIVFKFISGESVQVDT